MPVKEFFPALRVGNDARLMEIWDAYLSTGPAHAMKTANRPLDGAVIVSGYLAPYFKKKTAWTPALKVDAASPFPLVREQLLVGTHGQHTRRSARRFFLLKSFCSRNFNFSHRISGIENPELKFYIAFHSRIFSVFYQCSFLDKHRINRRSDHSQNTCNCN